MKIENNTLQEICNGLLIPNDELTNTKILAGAKRGIEWAMAHPNPDTMLYMQSRIVRSVVRRFNCPPEEAVMVLELPKEDRNRILKIAQAQLRQKENRKK